MASSLLPVVLLAILAHLSLQVLSLPVPLWPELQFSVYRNGLNQPISVKFSRDGRMFVAERVGKVRHFASPSAASSDVILDIRDRVHSYWDRGECVFFP